MRPEFDATDAEILAKREQLFNQEVGPRVGDHDWVTAHNGVYFKMRCRVFELV